MPILYGKYHGSADEKGRVMMPVDLIKQFGSAVKKGFFIKQSIFHKALELFTVNAWNKFSEDTDEVDTFSKKGMEFLMLFNDGVKHVSLDSNNRLNIPVELFEYAGIKKDVVIQAVKDRVVIWDRKTYEKFRAETISKIETITEDVMGPIKKAKANAK